MNIVLDTNSLIMSIAPKSPYRKVWNAFLKSDYNLCVSNEIIEEYSEVLSRNISPQVSEAIVYAILSRPNVIRKDPWGDADTYSIMTQTIIEIFYPIRLVGWGE